MIPLGTFATLGGGIFVLGFMVGAVVAIIAHGRH